MKRNIVTLLLLVGLICSCSDNLRKESLRIIRLDLANFDSNNRDISMLFEDDLEIIPLETNDSCMVRADQQKVLTENYIFIGDRTTKKISMFDWKGHFIRNIGALGKGPGEYLELGSFSFKDDSLYVRATPSKIIAYSVNNLGYREIKLKKPIYYSDFFVSNDNKLWFITDYCCDYNLISVDVNGKKQQNFLPYDKKIEKNESSWGLQNYWTACKDSTLITFSHNDTVYSLFHGNIAPIYLFDYSEDKLPAEIYEKSGTEILQTAMRENYISGVNSTYNTRDYILGGFIKGNDCFEYIYSKKTEKVRLVKNPILSNYGDLFVFDYLTYNNSFVFVLDASLLQDGWRDIISKNKFKDPVQKERMRKIIENLEKNDNPVVFRMRFKKY